VRFNGSAGLPADVWVMSSLHWLPTHYRGARYINPTDNNRQINRFYRLNKPASAAAAIDFVRILANADTGP